MKKATKTIKEVKKEKKKLIRAVLNVNNIDITAEGDTVFEALSNLKDPVDVLSFGVLRIYKGDKMAEQLLNVVRTKQLFADKDFRLITASNLEIA